MTTDYLTCADSVAGHKATREAQIQDILNDPNSDDNSDVALSVETTQLTTVCLSYGGPADYLEIYHDGAEITRVLYRFSDWFDTATIDVREGEALYAYAQYIVEGQGY